MSSDVEHDTFEQEPDSEDEMNWEEIDVPDLEPEEQHLEITFNAIPSSSKTKKTAAGSKPKGITHEERLVRINCHKIHTVVLLANAKVRNTWINDETLQARLMSLAPITLQNEFAQIHPSRIPDQGQRGRMFEKALQHLVQWWSGTFFEVLPSGHIRNHTFDEIQTRLESLCLLYDEGEMEDDTVEDILGHEIERVRGPKSLMKHALNRAIGIPARLVVSLQSVPWQPNVGKPKPAYVRKDPKGKARQTSEVNEGDESRASSSFSGAGQRLDGMPIPNSEKAKGKQKAEPVIKLRKQKDKGHRLGSSTPSVSSRLASPDPATTAPVFWTEVFSRPDSRWMPVDPVRGIVNKRKAFDPTPKPANAGGSTTIATSSMLPSRPAPKVNNYSLPKNVKQENRMQYVIAFEEDGYARDVTRRYAREYNAKIAKSQGGSSAGKTGGKARQVWWESVLGLVKRPYQLHRDDLEDEELVANQMMEGMPSTVSGFKDHPLYALTRHLKQTEVIHPPPPDTPEIGKFRGEPVYPRSSVVSLKSAETWMRTEGRIVQAGCQPLKTIKARPGTVNRIRQLEIMKDELRDAGHSAENVEVMQGLYSRSQTELYVPNPVVDGKIPKNDFGNIDLYVPTMLPKGAVHVPYKGTAKIAKKLGFDHAEAVTGFEFRKRRANAVIEGIVIAAEHETAFLEAYWEARKEEEQKARTKKEERALQNWIKLVQGLRIRDRLMNEYADRESSNKAVGSRKTTGKRARRSGMTAGGEDDDVESSDHGDEDAASHHGEEQGGGFLVGADDVVEAFQLPKYNPLILASSHSLFASGSAHRKKHGHATDQKDLDEVQVATASGSMIDFVTYDLDVHEPSPSETDMDEGVDEDVISGFVDANPVDGSEAPRTMQELLDADDHAKSTSNITTRSTSETLQVNGARSNIVLTPDEGAVTTKLRALPSRNSGNRTPRPSNANKRKRGVVDDGTSDEGSGDIDQEDGEFGSRTTTPRKRLRSAAKTFTQEVAQNSRLKPTTIPPTDRVLRSRRSKLGS